MAHAAAETWRRLWGPLALVIGRHGGLRWERAGMGDDQPHTDGASPIFSKQNVRPLEGRVVETVRGQRTDPGHIATVRARARWHVPSRINRTIRAHTMGISLKSM